MSIKTARPRAGSRQHRWAAVRSGVLALFLAAAAACAAAPVDAPAPEPGPRTLRDVAYGAHPRQRFDLHLPGLPDRVPLIVIVHGGAWARGDKDHPGLIPDKAAHWLPRGHALLSTNYRLVPGVTPVEQARDVARALAEARRRADEWALDPDRVVLLGHSAGAHLVALLAASPELLREAGAAPVRGAILLDSAAYDVEQVMAREHPRLYDRTFGADPAGWRDASPYARLSRTSAPMLVVCTTRHVATACAQARRFAAKAARHGVRVDVLPQDLGHMEVNRLVGRRSAYTEAIDAFIERVLPPG